MSSNSTPDFGRILGVFPDEEPCLGYVYSCRRRCRNKVDSDERRQIGECLRQGTECLERGQQPPGWILHRIAALGLCWSHQYQTDNLLTQWQNKMKEYREENPSVNEPARTRSGAIYEAPQGRTQAAYDPVQSVTPRPVRQDPEDTAESPVPELQVRSSPAPTPTNDQLMSELPSVRNLLASLEILAQSMVCQTDTTLRSGCGAKAIVGPTTIAAASCPG
ncbi:hypothetical protein CDV56_105297 [Aspergillus terreus]|uniref:Uncharacterized protein n=1 Tax=Aspergillus terreus TaxID=33178 RepID=A0A5M3Z4A0_ASPTE|nr:hypothetical protein ATETN484_0008024900 [Aspergillus terreus]GFF21150.1 hypothetical protein CDV56_105297 [Aspergillus terreus]